MNEKRYFIIYKPFGVLSQFMDENNRETLKGLFDFPKDVYPVGRLDADSEGLLLLTNDTRINHKLLNPKFAHSRTYLVQIDGQITPEAINSLEAGNLEIKINKKVHRTLPAKAKMVEEPNVEERNPPIRFRKSIPTSWLELSLTEGKNRQVRKMTAKVGFPTLRLIRTSIVNIELGEMKIGDVVELNQSKVYQKLFGR